MENEEPYEYEYDLEHRKLLLFKKLSLHSLQKLSLSFCLSSKEGNAKFDDTNKVVSQLLKKSDVSYPKHRGIKCKNKKDHPGQPIIPRCSPSCIFMCGDCDNMTKACCKSCELCTKCTLKNLGLIDYHELISKLVNGELVDDVCKILRLRLSVILLRIFRNFTSHLTDAKCKEIDKGDTSKKTPDDIDISPFCKCWEDIHNTYKFAIGQVFDYLKGEKCISENVAKDHNEFMEKVVKARQHSELDEYDSMMEKLNRLGKYVENIVKLKSIKVRVKFILFDDFEFDLEDSDEFEQRFKNAIESCLNKKDSSKITTKLVGEEPQNKDQKSLWLTFKIDSDNAALLSRYEDHKSGEVKKLFKSIKEELLKALPDNIKRVILKSWKRGSIIIGVAINKSCNEEWDENEIVEIEEKMIKFVEEFKFTGDLSKCTMTFKIESKCEKSSFTLVYQLDAFSEEMVSELDKIEKERFKACLQGEVSKMKEKISVAGMK